MQCPAGACVVFFFVVFFVFVCLFYVSILYFATSNLFFAGFFCHINLCFVFLLKSFMFVCSRFSFLFISDIFDKQTNNNKNSELSDLKTNTTTTNNILQVVSLFMNISISLKSLKLLFFIIIYVRKC